MKAIDMFLFLFGGIWAFVGGMITVVFLALGGEEFGPFIFIPLLFLIAGLVILGFGVRNVVKRREVRTKGNRYAAKIYSYVEDTSVVVNGHHTMNVVVHFFDNMMIEREAVIPTSFTIGSNSYPIGFTIDIFEYNGVFDFDKNSVRNEELAYENELMDDKPVSPAMLSLMGIECPNCGASFNAARGYSNKCPYCNSYINVE